MNLYDPTVANSRLAQMISGVLTPTSAQSALQNNLAAAAQRALVKQQQLFASLPTVQVQTTPTGAVPTAGAMPTGNLAQWINQALAATGHTGKYHDALASGLAKLISHESGGNPKAYNSTPVNNGANGIEHAQGLMQTLPSTFNAYALPGYSNIYNPVANIIAGLRYALSRYGRDMVIRGGNYSSSGQYLPY